MLTVIVKALNEEGRIAQCLDAAVREAATVGGEVLLVDSLSTDRTVEIARRYPVRIIQFARSEDCGCGAAVQLGFQYVRTPFVYVLDADMVLQPGFLAKALACLAGDPGLAGVGGKLLDARILTESDRRRAEQADRLTVPQQVTELGGGGLYRVQAIHSVGHLANRWLAAYEEAELGMRLRAAGWRLLRLPSAAVLHEGHAESNVAMLRRLWRNGRAQAGGALLRAAIGQPWFWLALRKQAYVLAVPLLHLTAILAAVAGMQASRAWPLLSGLALYVSVCMAFVLAMAARRRSARAGLWSAANWHFFAYAAARGLVRVLPDPGLPIAGRELASTSEANPGGASPSVRTIPAAATDVPLPSPRKKILMLGPSLKSPGGMTSVLNALESAGLFRAFNIEHVSTYERGGLLRQLLVMTPAALQLLAAILSGRVALVHAHSASRGSFVRKAMLCGLARVCRKPYVFHVHSGEFPTFYRNECSRLQKAWVRHTLRHAATVVCLTESWRARLATIEPRARVSVIGNPVKVPPMLRPVREQAAEILFLGRLREQKGVFDLLDSLPAVLERFPKMRLVLAGDEGVETCRERARQLGVAHAVVLPGWVDGVEKRELLRRADIFVLPSYAEGLPVGVLEAMALGIPIITTPVGGIPDLIVDGVHGLLVPPREPAALSQALLRLADDRTLRQTLCAAAYDRVRTQYALPVILAAYDRLYAEPGSSAQSDAALLKGETS